MPTSLFRNTSLLFVAALLIACHGGSSSSPKTTPAPAITATSCPLDGEAISITGSIAGGTAKEYFVIPVDIPSGTQRIEFLYGWEEINPLPSTGIDPNDSTVLDLGWWDQHGYRDPAGFRGWSGSRQARLDQGQQPGFIEAAQAERGYTAGVIKPGVWFAEIGVAITSRNGANYQLQIQCVSQGSGAAVAADPVDPNHIANANPGWYHGDFHMHGYHSNPAGADAFDMVSQARVAGLDVLFYTDYVVVAHWDQIGSAQRANTDLLFYPGREIITYRGHANTLGETRNIVEYRHGFEDITIGQIQQAAVEAHALFQVNHPKTFDIPGLRNLCRGCQWDYEQEIDWNKVHTMEVVTGPIITGTDQLGLPGLPVVIQNPFIRPAIDYWHSKLQQGYKITAVSGSDSRGAEPEEQRNISGYGSSATAILADALSQQQIRKAVLAGKAFVKVLGVDESPHVELEAITAGGQSVTYGGELNIAESESATLRLAVQNAQGQRLMLYRNAQLQQLLAVTSDEQLFEVTIDRDPASEGPLGSWWNYELVANPIVLNGQLLPSDVITAIGNPVFLSSPAQ